MNYIIHPAWRSQWFLMILAIGFFLLIFLPVVEATNGTNTIASSAHLIMALPFIVVVLIMLYRHFSRRFEVDGTNIESSHGIIARAVKSVRIADVRSIEVKQSIGNRILGIGNVQFSSAASPGPEVEFVSVTNPIGIKEKIQSMLSSY